MVSHSIDPTAAGIALAALWREDTELSALAKGKRVGFKKDRRQRKSL